MGRLIESATYSGRLKQDKKLREFRERFEKERRDKEEKLRMRAESRRDNRPWYGLKGMLFEEGMGIPLEESFRAGNDRQAIFETIRRLKKYHNLEGYGLRLTLKSSADKYIRTRGISEKGMIY